VHDQQQMVNATPLDCAQPPRHIARRRRSRHATLLDGAATAAPIRLAAAALPPHSRADAVLI